MLAVGLDDGAVVILEIQGGSVTNTCSSSGGAYATTVTVVKLLAGYGLFLLGWAWGEKGKMGSSSYYYYYYYYYYYH